MSSPAAALSRDGFIGLDRLSSRLVREPQQVDRDHASRDLYAQAALSQIPRILGAIDRNPYRPTFGCLDRAFWHYRTSDFACQMYQEALWPLALVYTHQMPGNRWYANPRVRELVIAGLRFTADSTHRNGSCDDYYPFERALGAAVFATNAAAQSYLLLSLDDAQLRGWFQRRTDWIATHQESGRLANHQALAALALYRASLITGSREHREAARERIGLVLAWQSEEGWFDEYGGADPGYQTVTLDCLAAYRNLTEAHWLNPAIERGLRFARTFLHSDHSYGGEYGSRGTHHFYPHGMELLASRFSDAAELADGFLESLNHGRQAHFSDDRMFAHYTGNLLEAWLDWSPQRPLCNADSANADSDFPQAGIYVRASNQQRTIVSTARGGVFKHFDGNTCRTSDAGLIVELSNGMLAASQLLDRTRQVQTTESGVNKTVEVAGPLHRVRCETFTPLKSVVFRIGMLLVGRWCGDLVRRLLQRRLITGRRAAPVRLTRRFEFSGGEETPAVLRVVDTIELTNRRARVKRMSFGSDHQTAYVAACGIYHDSVLESWTDLSSYVDELNRRRRVTITRQFASLQAPVVRGDRACASTRLLT